MIQIVCNISPFIHTAFSGNIPDDYIWLYSVILSTLSIDIEIQIDNFGGYFFSY